MRMKNLTIETTFRTKSWDELADMIFDLVIERKELQAKIEEAEKWKEYWFKRAEEWRAKYEEAGERRAEDE